MLLIIFWIRAKERNPRDDLPKACNPYVLTNNNDEDDDGGDDDVDDDVDGGDDDDYGGDDDDDDKWICVSIGCCCCLLSCVPSAAFAIVSRIAPIWAGLDPPKQQQ